MSKVELRDVTNLKNPITPVVILNGNFAAITTAIENTLSRDGTSPNEMLSQLDMNSNRIINLPSPVQGSEPIRLVDLANFIAGSTLNFNIFEYFAGAGLQLNTSTHTFSIANGGVTNAMLAGSIDVSKIVGLAAIATTGSASDLSTGTVPTGRIAGSYTGITAVGTLASLNLAADPTTNLQAATKHYVDVTAGTSFTAGAGLTLSSGVFSIATGGVTNAMLAGSIAASKLIGTDITTVGTLTAGATGAGFTVALSTSTITGTLADARLPTSMATKTFTGITTLTGNVFIGSATPSQLTIYGSSTYNEAFSTGTLFVSNSANINRGVDIGYDPSLESGFIQAGKNGVAYEPLLLNPNGGSVGVGTISPTKTLDVTGTLSISGISTFLNTIHLPNNVAIQWRNAANSTDINATFLDASNVFQVGGGAIVNVSSVQSTASPTTGALTVAGGLGVAASIYVGALIHLPNNTPIAARNVANSSDINVAYLDTANVFQLGGGSPVSVASTTASVSTATGSLTLAGGLGLAGAINAGSTCSIVGVLTVTNSQPVAFSATGSGQDVGMALNTSASGGHNWQILSSATGSGLGAGFHIYDATVGGVPAGRFSIDSSGNVGIGTITPTYSLDITRTANDFQTLRVFNSNGGASATAALIADNGTNQAFFGMRSTGSVTSGVISPNDAEMVSTAGICLFSLAGPIKFAANGTTEHMRIATTGSIGIGITSPDTIATGTGTAIGISNTGANKIFVTPYVDSNLTTSALVVQTVDQAAASTNGGTGYEYAIIGGIKSTHNDGSLAPNKVGVAGMSKLSGATSGNGWGGYFLVSLDSGSRAGSIATGVEIDCINSTATDRNYSNLGNPSYGLQVTGTSNKTNTAAILLSGAAAAPQWYAGIVFNNFRSTTADYGIDFAFDASNTFGVTAMRFPNNQTIAWKQSGGTNTNCLYLDGSNIFQLGGGLPIHSASTTASSSITTGSVTMAGGLGVAGTIYTGGLIHLPNNTALTARNVANSTDISITYLDTSDVNQIGGGLPVHVAATTATSSSTTGALTVAGGLGLAGDTISAGDITITKTTPILNLNSTSGIITLNYAFSGTVSAAITHNGSGIIHYTNAALTTGQYMLNGGSSWIALSDERLAYKQTAREITDELPSLDGFHLYERTDGVSELFVKAQEFYKLFPHLVIKGSDDTKFTPTKLADPRAWGVINDRSGMVALAYAKQHAARITSLEKELEDLKTYINNLNLTTKI